LLDGVRGADDEFARAWRRGRGRGEEGTGTTPDDTADYANAKHQEGGDAKRQVVSLPLVGDEGETQAIMYQTVVYNGPLCQDVGREVAEPTPQVDEAVRAARRKGGSYRPASYPWDAASPEGDPAE